MLYCMYIKKKKNGLPSSSPRERGGGVNACRCAAHVPTIFMGTYAALVFFFFLFLLLFSTGTVYSVCVCILRARVCVCGQPVNYTLAHAHARRGRRDQTA